MSKITKCIWIVLAVMPFLVYLFILFGNPNYEWNCLEYISLFWKWEPVSEFLNSMIEAASWESAYDIASYISYLAEISIYALVYQVIIFVPSFAYDLITKLGGKWRD